MDDIYTGADKLESYLEHHGIKGMRWGVRRYQNKDGSLTPAGEARRKKIQAVKEAREVIIGAVGGAAIAVALGLGGTGMAGVIGSLFGGAVIGTVIGGFANIGRLAITGGQIADSMNLGISKIKTAGTNPARLQMASMHNMNQRQMASMHNMNQMHMATMHNMNQTQMASMHNMNQTQMASMHNMNQMHMATMRMHGFM